jgi:single stranded DNA-binding protein
MSNDTNLVIITARLTRDPDGRNLNGGSFVADLGVAVNESWKDRNLNGGSFVADLGVAVNESWKDRQSDERKEKTHFVDVTFFGQPADFACQYLKKGDKVLIEAALDMQSWDDRNTGEKRSKLKLKGRRIQALMPKQNSEQQQPQATRTTSTTSTTTTAIPYARARRYVDRP